MESLAAETLEAGSAAERNGGEHCKLRRGKRQVRDSSSGGRKRHSPLHAVFSPDVSGSSGSVVPTATHWGGSSSGDVSGHRGFLRLPPRSHRPWGGLELKGSF